MEPTIMDGSTILVKQVEDLLDGDIGIFNVNGEIMCKRYIVNGEKIILKPDNESGMFSNIDTSQAECILQGKVLLNLN